MLPKDKLLNEYEVKIAKMQLNDIPKLHELSLSVRWPHRDADWAELLKLGEGFVIHDLIGRLVSSMMWFSYDKHFASVGMGISSPRLQALGAGRWLAEHVQNQIGNRNVLLVATRDSLPLCLSLDFKVIQNVYHHNGYVKHSPSTSNCSEEIQVLDHDEIKQLDSAAMGFSRDKIISQLLANSQGRLIRHNGEITGFALCRKFGRGYVIGPIIAKSQELAIELVRPLLNNLKDEFVRIDTYLDSGAFKDFIKSTGLNLHETATKMARGNLPIPKSGIHTIGLASQALG